MIKLINWTAKRAGGRITINGINAGNMTPLKVIGVDMIESALTSSIQLNSKKLEQSGVVIATDKDGTQYELG